MLKLALVAGLLLPLLWAGRAEATHEAITVDGNLSDLIGAIGRNTGASNGGFSLPDGVQGEIYTSSCRYVNGYDVRNYYFFLDFKDAAGRIAPNVRFYGGWDVYGIIGDVDGDGNPSTFNPPVPPAPGAGCPQSDEAGIGPLESYTIEINYDCDAAGLAEQRIIVKDGRVVSQVGSVTTDLTGRAQFSFVGGFLELRVDNFQTLVPAGADIGSARIRMTANAEMDLLGEDRSSTVSLAIQPAVSVTKTPSRASLCPGETVDWTIVVRNDGFSPLQSVTLADTLATGLSYVSSSPSRASGDAQRSNFTVGTLAVGESRTFTLRAMAGTTCASPTLLNRAGVEGTHVPPALCGPAVLAVGNTVASIACAPCPPPPGCAVTVTPGTAVCTGTPFEVCGPTGTYTYRWTLPNGSIVNTRCVSISSATLADAGLYRLDLTNGGATVVCSTRVAVREVICSITGPKVVCQDSRVELCGPEGPYTYRWTTPGGSVRTTRCIVIDPATEVNSGVYTLVVTDPATGCSATCSHELVVSPRPPAKINGPNYVCFGGAVELCAVEGYNYLWTLPGGGTTTSRCISIASAANIHNGTYRLIISDRGSGCRDTVDHFLTVTPPLDCTITGPSTVCLDAAFTLTAPAAPGGTTYSYRWTLPGGEVLTGRTVTIAAAADRHTGLYTVEVTDLTTGCKNTCSRTITVTAPPCEITGPTVVCEGDPVQLCGPQGTFTYLWTLPGGATRTTRCVNLGAATPAMSGVYTLRVTDTVTGCSRTCEHKLQVNPKPPCTITGPTTVCVGSPLQLCGPEGQWTYHWTLPDGTVRTSRCVTIPVAAVANSGLYTLRVVDPVTACSTSCDRKVTVLPPPPCEITGPEVVCAGAPAELCGPTGAFTYLWTRPNGTTATTRCISIPAAAAGDAGVYTLRVTDPATTCVTTCTRTLRIGAPPCTITPAPVTPPTTSPAPGVTAVCAGNPFQLCGPEGAFTYLWTLPNGTTSTSRCISVTAATPGHAGTYRLTVTDPTAPACPATCTHEVRVGAAPCEITGPDVVCAGAPAELCGPTGTFTYLWTRPNGTTATSRCLTIPAATAGDGGVYTLRVTDPATGCMNTCTKTLRVGGPPCTITPTIPTTPGPAPGVTGVCTGQTFELCGPEGAFTYLWTLPNGTTRTTRCVRVTSAAAGDAGTYRLTVTDPTAAQCPTTCTHEVRVAPPCEITGPSVAVIGSRVDLCAPTGDFDYLWTLPNGTTRTTQCVVIASMTAADSGLYTLRLTHRPTGCVTTCSHRLSIPPADCKLVVTKTAKPDEITPPGPVSCESLGARPSSITFTYTGLGCAGSDNDQAAGKWSCEELGPNGEPVQIVYTGKDPAKFTVSPSTETIRPGDEFTVTATGRSEFHADSKFEIRRGGVVVERLMIHTSCSQPFAVGDAFGSLEVFALNGQSGGGPDVTYDYTVTNFGSPMFGIMLVDDKLGTIAGPFDLTTNATRAFSRTVPITETTVNRAVATGRLGSPTGPECADTAFATVRVIEPSQTCDDGKPVQLGFEYTGETCAASSNTQEPGKWSCADVAPLGTEPVRFVYTGPNPANFTVSPADESIRPGDIVTITAVGQDRFSSAANFEIRRGATVLQRVMIHTSCSQPFNIGDQFGSMVLRVFRISAEPILVPIETEALAPAIGDDAAAPAPVASSLAKFALDVKPATVFTGKATVGFSLTRGGPVRLSVHDVQGRVVATLAQGHWAAGNHHVDWDPSANVGSGSTGIYFIRLEAAEGVLTRKVARLR